ncbi:PUA-like domain-containing protein [Schizophyllum amplum]|uniref:PUA-like domain-containing protein n=1 Tax=Schizophyllum amplum TaxID=97359 RepID=A0A550BXK0_9AGAR|nr:PUA-like domain-containing protein [Auriculariopsis ampla]
MPHNGKRYGDIPGIPPGTIFADRKALKESGVHAVVRQGIHAEKLASGAYSVLVNGGYHDDDQGETIVYIGHGGLDSKTGKQVNDQIWTYQNKSLQTSYTTRKPVRVIRGHQLNSPYAPEFGFRYDGLYRVMNVYSRRRDGMPRECVAVLERITGQPPLPPPRNIAGPSQASEVARPEEVGLLRPVEATVAPHVEGGVASRVEGRVSRPAEGRAARPAEGAVAARSTPARPGCGQGQGGRDRRPGFSDVIDISSEEEESVAPIRMDAARTPGSNANRTPGSNAARPPATDASRPPWPATYAVPTAMPADDRALRRSQSVGSVSSAGQQTSVADKDRRGRVMDKGNRERVNRSRSRKGRLDENDEIDVRSRDVLAGGRW